MADEPELSVGARSLGGDRLDPLERPLTPKRGRIVGDPVESSPAISVRAPTACSAPVTSRARSPWRAASQRFSPTTSRFAFATPSPRS